MGCASCLGVSVAEGEVPGSWDERAWEQSYLCNLLTGQPAAAVGLSVPLCPHPQTRDRNSSHAEGMLGGQVGRSIVALSLWPGHVYVRGHVYMRVHVGG